MTGTDGRLERRGLRASVAVAITLAAFAALTVFGGLGFHGPVSASAHEYQYGTNDVIARVTSIQPTCPDFRANAAPQLAEASYRVRADGRIGSVNPWAIRYWTQVHAPATSFTIDVVQTSTHSSFPLFDLVDPGNVRLHDAACRDVASAIVVNGDQARVTVGGSAPGQVYYLSVRYGTQPFLGKPAPSPATVHYDFRTLVDGVVTDGDPNGLDLKKQ
jgi:hypothetical protein